MAICLYSWMAGCVTGGLVDINMFFPISGPVWMVGWLGRGFKYIPPVVLCGV
jgi:hypothetical protein